MPAKVYCPIKNFAYTLACRPDLPSSAIETFVTFTDAQLGKSGSAWIRTTGDNGTVDNCNKVGFTVNNSAQVRPVENFGFVWVEHVV